MQYYLHIYNRVGETHDDEGQDLPHLDAAGAKAIEGIRGILSEEVKGGMLDLRGRVDIVGGDGAVLRTVRFGEALQLHLDIDAS